MGAMGVMLSWLLVAAVSVAVPVFIGVVLWRFLLAYELRSRHAGDVEFLQRRVQELEAELRELRAEVRRSTPDQNGQRALTSGTKPTT
jgi:hypothetical protein